MRRPNPIIFTLLCCLPTLFAPAVAQAAALARMTDLHGFEVVVADTSAAERRSGLEKGLEQVMVRVTGDKRIGTHPAAAGLFSQVDNYVRQYGYDEREVIEPEIPDDAREGDAAAKNIFTAQAKIRKELVLKGHFEPVVLEKALRQAGLPVWDTRRPLILLLGTVDTQDGNRTTNDESLQPILEDAATLRGLPIRLPAAGGLDARSIWKGDRFALDDAARAAGVDFVHWSRISQQGSPAAGQESLNWVVEAALYQQGELVREWYFSANSEETALRRLVDELTDWMAGRYAVASGRGGRSVVGLHVAGVDNIAAYARVQAVLAELGAVEKLELVAAGHEEVIYRVTTRSDAGQFENSLTLSRQLVPSGTTAQHMRAPVWLGEMELYYRLQ